MWLVILGYIMYGVMGGWMRFREGDIVKIRKDSRYSNENEHAGSSNPPNTEGTVIEIRSGSLCVRTRWDNGLRNSYEEKDLGLVRRG